MFSGLFPAPTPAADLKTDFQIIPESYFTDRTSPKSFICLKYGQNPWKSRAGAVATFPWESFSRVKGACDRGRFFLPKPTAEQ